MICLTENVFLRADLLRRKTFSPVKNITYFKVQAATILMVDLYQSIYKLIRSEETR